MGRPKKHTTDLRWVWDWVGPLYNPFHFVIFPELCHYVVHAWTFNWIHGLARIMCVARLDIFIGWEGHCCAVVLMPDA